MKFQQVLGVAGLGFCLLSHRAEAQDKTSHDSTAKTDKKATLTDADSAAITDKMIEHGRSIFHGQGMCFGCHGASLEGTPAAPTLMAHAWKDAKNGSYAAIYQVVTHGVNGTAMVAFPGGISEADARAVAAYVWSTSHKKVKP